MQQWDNKRKVAVWVAAAVAIAVPALAFASAVFTGEPVGLFEWLTTTFDCSCPR